MVQTATPEQPEAAKRVNAAEGLTQKLRSLQKAKNLLNEEVGSLTEQQEKIKPAADLNAKIQLLMRAVDPEQVPLLAAALHLLEAVVDGPRLQAEAIKDPDGDHGEEDSTGRFLR